MLPPRVVWVIEATLLIGMLVAPPGDQMPKWNGYSPAETIHVATGNYYCDTVVTWKLESAMCYVIDSCDG